jgi:hypothetical protein
MKFRKVKADVDKNGEALCTAKNVKCFYYGDSFCHRKRDKRTGRNIKDICCSEDVIFVCKACSASQEPCKDRR